MSLAVVQGNVQSTDASVSSAGGAVVSIYDVTQSGDPLASLFTDRAGTTSASNPVVADSGGFFRVYTAATRVRIVAEFDGNTQTWEDVALSVDGYDETTNIEPGLFWKDDGSAAAWEAPTTTTLQTKSAIQAEVEGIRVVVPAATSVTLPALSNGTDYFVYLASDGTLQAVDADSAAPSGERLVGGFHCRAGDGEINPYSFWDLNWRPKSYPRAMAIDPGKNVWADIYLTDVEYTLYGYSRPGQTIADDGNRPILPATVGGDGTALCPSASWWQFLDIFYAAGKCFGIYEELVSLAYGVVERQAVGSDPVTTQHQAGHRSACGCEQITGVMWQWFSGASATAGSSWSNIAEGRGDVYASNLKAPRFGASWNNGSSAGSRSSSWYDGPSSSSSRVGARGVSDHVNLQAEG